MPFTFSSRKWSHYGDPVILRGSVGRRVTVSIDGRRIGAPRWKESYADQYLPGFSQACTDAGQEAVTVDTYPDQPQATLALSSGRADATISDVGPLAYVAQQSEGRFEVLDANYQPAPYGLALPKGSELGPAVEAAVRALVADGTYAAVLERWDVQAGAVDDPVLQRG